MLTPVIPELTALLFKWLVWMGKDWKFRLPFSFLSIAGYLILCGLLAFELKRGDSNLSRWIGSPVYVAFGLALIILYVRGLVKTLEGYASLMSKPPRADGHCVTSL